MAAGAPQIGQLKSEIASATEQKKNVSSRAEQIKKATVQLESRIGSIKQAISQLRDRLSGQIPPEARKQITDQLSDLNNKRKQMITQLSAMREQYGQAIEAVKGISKGITMRKNALTRIAGQLTRMPMYNRENGTKKG